MQTTRYVRDGDAIDGVVARALMQRLVRLCHERRCGEMFTLTGAENEAAQATYKAAGGEAEPAGIMFHWDWSVGK